MNKIMMTKYGFVRWPEEDFSDDGTRFTCYKIGKRVRVSKTVCNGQAFIDARIDGIKLPYDVYCDLPHYLATGKLNGVSIATLTDKDLFDLAEACLLYEKEYEEAEASIVLPSIEEIRARCTEVKAKLEQEVATVDSALAKGIVTVAAKLSSWEWKELGRYLNSLKGNLDDYDIDAITKRYFGMADSIKFCSDDSYALQPSFAFRRIEDLLAKCTSD